VAYLFSKQIEESKLLVLNKLDLFQSDKQNVVLAMARERFPEKIILLQNSLDHSGLLPWLDALEDQLALLNRPGFVVDYPKYKRGESEMAWLDQKFTIESLTPATIKPALIELIRLLLNSLQKEDAFVGHLKLMISFPEKGTKLSFTTADFLEKPFPSDWIESVPEVSICSLSVTLNARVAIVAAKFSEIVKNAVNQAALSSRIYIRSEEGSSYNPEMSMNRP
jgi:hypothetical protein